MKKKQQKLGRESRILRAEEYEESIQQIIYILSELTNDKQTYQERKHTFLYLQQKQQNNSRLNTSIIDKSIKKGIEDAAAKESFFLLTA